MRMRTILPGAHVPPQIPAAEKLRLVLLFALRYERDGKMQVGKLLESLGTDDARNSVRTSPAPIPA
jgi:hypothetical protein